MTDAGRPTGLTVADEQTWLRLRNHVARERGFWFGVLFTGTRLGLNELARRCEGFLVGQGRSLTRRFTVTPADLRAAIDEVVGELRLRAWCGSRPPTR